MSVCIDTTNNNTEIQQRILNTWSQIHLNILNTIPDMEEQIDPHIRFFSPNIINCSYYTVDEYKYNCSIKPEGKLSIIHFNSRSMYANFNSIKDYLKQFLQPFSIITISETWFNDDKGV